MDIFLINITTTTATTKHAQTHTQIHTQKKRKKENGLKLLVPTPLPFHFKQSINQSYNQYDTISLKVHSKV